VFITTTISPRFADSGEKKEEDDINYLKVILSSIIPERRGSIV